jgi:CHAD domain-containing protein
MADGKWISDLEATTHLADAARRVLTERLDVVRHYLPLAVAEPEKDTEYVHQLRVGTRRAGAALRIFCSCLPDKVHETARKQLRRLRRAAGAARDWDVFLAMLGDFPRQGVGALRPGLDFLCGHAFAERQQAQEQLRKASKDYLFAFDRLLVETVAAVREPKPRGHPLVGLARPMLSSLLRELDRAAAQDLEQYEQLHQVRIAGKRLRYAMEVFADCFQPAFREELYPAVEEMQSILGAANDSHVARQRLEGLRAALQAGRPDDWKRFKAGIERLLRFHQQRLPRERRRFLQWWQRWQASGAEAALARLLRRAPSAAS